jgi:hypothetical protein
VARERHFDDDRLRSNDRGARIRGFERVCREESPLDSQTSQFPGPQKDLREHGAVQAAGVGIPQRWMVGSEKMQTIGEQILCPVGEVILGFASNDAGVQQVGEVAVEGDLSETDDHTNTWQRVNLLGEVGGAVADLLGQRLVAGRSTADDGGNPGMAELETIVAGDGAGLAGEAKLMQDGIHEVARAIASEGTTGAIRSVSTRSQAKDENTGAGVAEARNGTGPVGLILVGTAFRFADAAAVVAQAGTALTGDDGVANLMEEWGRILCVERWHCIDDSRSEMYRGNAG